MSLIKCPDCGTEISDSARTCPKCGYPLAEKLAEQKQKEAEAEKEKAKAEAMAARYEKEQQVKNKVKSNKKWIIIAAAALAVIVAAVLILPGLFRPAFNPGDIVTLGSYPQGANGEVKPIEWIVLEKQDNKALLISRYGLDAKPYNTEYTNITWENCTLRKWLNGEFLNKAFTAKEQTGILTTAVDNSAAQGYSDWSTSGGNNTQDKVFLLSFAEANKYFGVRYYEEAGAGDNVKARVQPTAYAIAQGAWTNIDYKTESGEPAGFWWLRSPGGSRSYAAFVYAGGSLSSSYVDYVLHVVRPALWVDLKSGIF